MKTIYATLLLVSVCAFSGVRAQGAGDENRKYYTLERIRSKSGWLAGDNPAGLIRNEASLSTADASYDFEKGGLRNVADGNRVHAVGVQSESFRRMGRLSFYGKLGFDYKASSDRAWAGNTDLYTSPMSMGDSVPGNTRDEIYTIKAGVAYEIGRWAVGVQAEYEDRSLAKRRDARNRTSCMHLAFRPGVLFASKAVDAGLNLSYRRVTEQVGYQNFGTNSSLRTIYFFEGLWFYTTEQIITKNIDDVYYKGSEYGGAAQVEFKFGDRVRFFNQFSAEYDKTERYRDALNMKLGDNDRLTYRYLGVLNHTGRRVDQRLSVDASWGDLLKYNNIQELELDPVTNQKEYRQYGRFLKFSQRQRSVDAGYTLYVKRNEWSSSWIADLAFAYFRTESEYTISPARYNQELHSAKLMLGVTKNILFNGRNWLDVTVRGGYAFGGGTELAIDCPEGVRIEDANYRADLLSREFGFLTCDRLNGEGGLRYTHYFPAKRIGLYIDLKGRAAWARSGLLDGSRRGGVFAAVGLNF